MNIYLKSGYCDIESIIKTGMPFIFVYGGRGIGKSYGALQYVLKNKRKFLFVRRTQSQIDLVAKPEFSPFKAVMVDMGLDVQTKSITKYNAGFYLDNELIGYAAALSTISNIRGFDASDVELIIYDEFIPEKHERPIREEGAAFLNMVETVGRNRELKGGKPLQVICLANSNDLGNPIFMELNLIKIVEKMKARKRAYYINKDRGILLVSLDESPISKKKKETSLYKLTSGSDFEKMALQNEFVDDSIAINKSRNLKEFVPYVKIADCCIYKHKSDNRFYMSEHTSGSPPEFTTASADLERFRRKYYFLWNAYLERRIEFENKLCSLLFERLW